MYESHRELECAELINRGPKDCYRKCLRDVSPMSTIATQAKKDSAAIALFVPRNERRDVYFAWPSSGEIVIFCA